VGPHNGGMSKRFAWSAFALCLALLSAGVSFAGEVKITKAEGKLRIKVDGQHFADYVYEGYSRPFLYPLIGPGGAKMTRNWPMAEAENEERDHPHHKSLWWAHGAMNGVDFWAEGKDSGKTVHQEFTAIESGKVGVIKSRNNYVSKEGKTICTDERTLRIYPVNNDREVAPGGRAIPGRSRQVFDFEITLQAGDDGLTFGDTKEGTMSMRLAETMRLKGKVGKGHIVNSEGVRDGDTWGKRAKWVDYHGPVDGTVVGAAIFDHPTNPRYPTWWHVRDYGLFGANPFGIHDFEKKEKGAGDLKVNAGEKITFRYRFYLHRGDEKEGRVSEEFDRYVKEIK
jgi:hypothetical protein